MVAKGKVLLIDDDAIVRHVTTSRLESTGYVVVTRANAIGTSRVILEERPDVVLLDVQMPGLSGDALAQLLQNLPRQARTSVIFYSSEAAAVLAKLALIPGVIGFLQKTSDAASFLREFEALFGRRQAKSVAS
jgi:CheY-like chemotaxis protein